MRVQCSYTCMYSVQSGSTPLNLLSVCVSLFYRVFSKFAQVYNLHRRNRSQPVWCPDTWLRCWCRASRRHPLRHGGLPPSPPLPPSPSCPLLSLPSHAHADALRQVCASVWRAPALCGSAAASVPRRPHGSPRTGHEKGARRPGTAEGSKRACPARV
jgi:hypothetical protein